MATTTTTGRLTLDEFRREYATRDRAYEFWYGEAVEKAVPTWLHAALQLLLGEVLRTAGFKAGSELELRVDPDWEPRPDLVGTRQSLPGPFPTDAAQIELVVEILSPDDRFVEVVRKCAEYQRIGIAQILVADPNLEIGYEWNRQRGQLDRVETWTLANGYTISLAEVWRELKARS